MEPHNFFHANRIIARLSLAACLFFALALEDAKGQTLNYRDMLDLQTVSKEATLRTYLTTKGFKFSLSDNKALCFESVQEFKFPGVRKTEQTNRNMAVKHCQRVGEYRLHTDSLVNEGASFITHDKSFNARFLTEIKSLRYHEDYACGASSMYAGMYTIIHGQTKVYLSDSMPTYYVEMTTGTQRRYNDNIVLYEISLLPYDSAAYYSIKERALAEVAKAQLLASKPAVVDTAPTVHTGPMHKVQGKITSLSESKEGVFDEFNEIPDPVKTIIRVEFDGSTRKEFILAGKDNAMNNVLLGAQKSGKVTVIEYVESEEGLLITKIYLAH